MKKETKKKREVKRLALLLLLSSIFTIILSELVLAQGVFGRVNNMFARYAANPAPGFLDFFVFFIIFFALCWIGFNQVFKDARKANVALSVAVGLALSVALVYGGRFTLKKLIPFAAIILFILIILGIYVLLKKTLFTKDTKMSKILAFIITIILAILLIAVAWNMICSDYTCERNPFMQRFIGSQSWIGKAFGGVSSAFGGPSYAAPPTTGPPSVGVKDITTPPKKAEGTDYLPIIAGVILLLLFGLGGYKGVKWFRKEWKHAPIEIFAKSLKEVEDNERQIIENFKKLYEAVKNEQTIFDESRHVVDKITTDIKETIGGEIDFVKGEKPDIDRRIIQLQGFNFTESHIITDPMHGILHHIDEQMNQVNTILPGLKAEINEFENVEQYFKEHHDILETFKQHDFREKNALARMIERLNKNKEDFQTLSDKCRRMQQILAQVQTEVNTISRKKLDSYHLVVKHVREIRDASIRLNKLFAWKVNMIHYLAARLKELQHEIADLHRSELATMERYLNEAQLLRGHNKMDIAIYLALHVVENAKYLVNHHLDDDAKGKLKSQVKEAKKLITECIPKLFDSLKDRIQGEIDYGNYKRLIKLSKTIERLKAVEKEFDQEFRTLINNVYANKISLLMQLCKELDRSGTARDELFRELGITI
jgi:hypothetical protein